MNRRSFAGAVAASLAWLFGRSPAKDCSAAIPQAVSESKPPTLPGGREFYQCWPETCHIRLKDSPVWLLAQFVTAWEDPSRPGGDRCHVKIARLVGPSYAMIAFYRETGDLSNPTSIQIVSDSKNLDDSTYLHKAILTHVGIAVLSDGMQIFESSELIGGSIERVQAASHE